jgi:hypothetical protein
MKVWAIWFGGGNYAAPMIPDDVESFPSLTAARYALEQRYGSDGWEPVPFNYVNRPEVRNHVPVVDITSELWIYLYDPTNEHDPYPDKRIRLTRNGGSRVERT